MAIEETTADQVLKRAGEVSELYHRLVLVVSPPEGDHSGLFKSMADREGVRLVNVNRQLSERMLDLTARQRSLRAASLLGDVIAGDDNKTILFENIEVLFDAALRLDPLRLLLDLSRRKTIIASWKGRVQETYLFYAEPDHPEYRRYSTSDLNLIDLE